MSINDATNRIKLFTIDGPIPVTGGGGGTEYTEGATHVPPALGNAVLGVVDISSPALTDQTYTTLRFDAAGNLRTTGSGPGTVDVIALGGNPIDTDAGATGAGTQRVVITTDQAKERDAVAGANDQGIMALSVRKDVAGTLVGADGDYTPLQVTATGSLRVDVASGPTGTEYVSGDAVGVATQGPASVAIRKDANGALTGVANGDYSALQVDSAGRLKTGTEYVESAVPSPTTQGPLAMAIVAGAGIAATLKMDAATDRLNTRDVSTFQWNQASTNGTDYGMAASAVRVNYAQPLANQNNVYSPLQTDLLGSLRAADPRMHVDPYGRQTVASPFVTGDYRFQHDPFPDTDPTWGAEFWARYNTVTWDSDRLWVVVGSGAWLQTKAAHPYYSGKAQRVEFSVNNMLGSGSRCGYFHQTKITSTPDAGGSMDGMWLDTVDGNVRFRIQRNDDSVYDVEQSSWNVDTLNGSGDPNTNPSGITVDFSRTLVATFEFMYAENIVFLYISQNVPGAALLNGPRYLANIARVTTEVTDFLMMACPNQPVTFFSNNGELRVFWAQVSSLGVTPAEMPGIPRNVSNAVRIRDLSQGNYYALCGIKLGDSTVRHPIRTNCLYPSFLSITAQPTDNDATKASPFTWWLIINPLEQGSTTTPFTPTQGTGWLSGNTPLGSATYQTYVEENPDKCSFTPDSILFTGTGYSSVTQQWKVPPLRRIGTGVDTSQNTSAFWDELWVVVEPTYPSASLDFTASLTVTEIF